MCRNRQGIRKPAFLLFFPEAGLLHVNLVSLFLRHILRRYFSTRCGMQRHRALPQNPQGHGLSAAMSMKLAGNTAEPFDRAIETRRSSSGSRKALMTSRWNSGNSSAKSTPRCASVASPGRIPEEPPPMSAAYEDVWCGERNGGRNMTLPPSVPESE